MRMSPTQIDAIRRLIDDPAAKVRAGTIQALKHRGLVDGHGVPTALGRQAVRELEAESPSRPETRIHLENEPATLAQLRVLKPLLRFEPDDLSKEDASTLISCLKDLQKWPGAIEARLPALGLLLRAGAQAVDAIGFSDQNPVCTEAGETLVPCLVAATSRRGRPLVTPGLSRADGGTIAGRPVTLRPRGDVPLSRSRARAIFLHLARTASVTHRSS